MNTKKTKENVERPNKSQIKRDIQALYEQATYICELKAEKVQRLDLHPTIINAIEELKRIKSIPARNRHIQYITRLLSEQNNLEDIQHILFEYQNPHLLQQQIDRKIDLLSNKLLNGDQKTIDEVMSQAQLIDRQNFLQLLRNAQKEYQKSLEDSKNAAQDNLHGIDTQILKAPDGKQTKKFKKLLRELFKK